jgi:hypothetical protein
MAKKGEVDLEKFTVYESKMPEKRGNSYIMDFGEVFVLKSLKNFLIEQDGQAVFMCYKSAESVCSIRIREPFTPLLAIVLAIPIVLGG